MAGAGKVLEAGGVRLVGDEEPDERQAEHEGNARKKGHADALALDDPGAGGENEVTHGIANKQAACRSLCESGSG